jgi:hypothetical protein
MRLFSPLQFIVTAGGAVFLAFAALAARAEDRLGFSEIRLTSAEEPAEAVAEKRSTIAALTDEETSQPPAPDAAPTDDVKPARLASIKPFRRPAASASTATRRQAEPPVSNTQIRGALNFYGGNPARVTLSQFPARTPIQAGPQQPIGRQIKPFNTIYREPTISPYMNLYREENDSQGAPNYFAFVRPQLDQNEEIRMQQMEIQKLSRQTQGRARTTVPQQYRAAGNSNRSTPARYMDTAQFYGGWSR